MHARRLARAALSGSFLVFGCNALVGVEDDYRLAPDAGHEGTGGKDTSTGGSSTGGSSGKGGSGGGTPSGGSGGNLETGGGTASGGESSGGADGGDGGADSDGGVDGGSGGVSGSGGATASGGASTTGGTTGTGGASCTPNACGGCQPLTGKVGDGCNPCGALACSGQALACQSRCTGATSVCKTDTQTCVACKPGAVQCSGSTQQTCSAAGSWTSAVVVGQCGATCLPQTLRCQNQIGQVCDNGATSWISSGSAAMCACAAPSGRFLKTAANRIKDTTSGLTWDFPLNASATYPDASANCTGKGMRLPHASELSSLNATMTQVGFCQPTQALGIDSVAFPEVAAGGASPRYWTGDPESGFPGYLYVLYFTPGGGSGTTDRTASQAIPYLCVSGP